MYINHANESACGTTPALSYPAQLDDDCSELEPPETNLVAILTACALVLTLCTALTAILRAFE